jgi:LmbE family N-acetylglucosaminyl deacetylase
MTEPDRKVALAFMAHPDDAEILCAGALMALAEAGWEIHVATATAGDLGTMEKDPWEISAVRTAEGRKAAAKMGGAYHCLGENDLFVVFGKPTLRKTLELFRRLAPTLVFTHAPSDYMPDHEEVSRLARTGTFGYGAPNVSDRPVVPGSQIPWLYYCDPIEARDALGRPVAPTTVLDITDQIEKKADVLATHASQREWLRAYHGMDEYLESMRRHGAERGELIGADAAEAFVQHRGHAYPREDLLAEILGATPLPGETG